MRNIMRVLFLAGLATFVSACENDESEGIMKGVIRFPSIILQGNELTFIGEDELYSDAGANAFLGLDDITNDMVTESTVDTSIPGVYTVNYSASVINELGQESVATEQRLVVVYPANPNTVNDLTGTYKRTSNGGLSVWTKVEDVPGVYTVTNIGGVVPPTSALLEITAYAFHFDDGAVEIPAQPVFNGILSADLTLSPAGYTIVLSHPNFGTNARIFVKQ